MYLLTYLHPPIGCCEAHLFIITVFFLIPLYRADIARDARMNLVLRLVVMGLSLCNTMGPC